MMFKSSLTTLLLLATLAILASAQDPVPTPPTPTTTTVGATTTTGGSVAPTATITGTGGVAPPAPTNNLTAVPDFSSLASAIASLATGRSQNPGYSPTPKPDAGNSAARLGGDVVTGLVLVVLSAVVAGAGTLAL
ncbi:hypothetical protein EC991_000932 [Linnemannia zychae]|nr:hypothetical protein EC991_000932 [Linnemannia zychae]